VQREAQCHGEEGKEEFDVIHKIVKTTALDTLVGEPIADEQDNGADDEEAGHFEHPTQMPVGIFDVEHGDAQQGHDEHTKEHGAVQKVHHAMELGLERNVLRLDDAPNGLSKVFGTPFVPTKLLGTGGTDHHGKLSRRFHIFQIFELPVFQLCTVAQIEIFGEGIAFPVACVEDTFLSPDSGGTVKVDEVSFGVSSHLFQSKVGIQCKGLDSGQGGVITVDVSPTGLHHTDFLIFEVGNRFVEPIAFGKEVGIEYGNEFPFGNGQSFFECRGLVSFSVLPADMLYVE